MRHFVADTPTQVSSSALPRFLATPTAIWRLWRGRVVADWPGLKTADRFEARDLKPTTDLRAVLKGVLADHPGLSADALSRTVFPDTFGVKPMSGLIAA